tara:strand:- start:494 stop:862 length:369 start_codon:yes stop_codon:yes gene_type:complete
MEFIDCDVWVPVHTLPGFESCIEYYVNEKGDVKSTKGEIERILKPKLKKNGYLTVNLTQRIGRRSILTVQIHVLVAYAFLGMPPTPYGRTKGCSRIKHINGNRTDCRANNLRWIKLSSPKTV